ncbi:MAG: hypothetical protein EXQ71_12090 [Acidimicrobiia bacterium]|nr:hypothetical protein [Acidimicrobiia bacterium]
MRGAAAALGVVVAMALVAGCGSTGNGESSRTVDVGLSDFVIDLSKDLVSRGEVTFDLDNKGPSVHEFVVFKTDLAPTDLPIDAEGDVLESDALGLIDEVEDIKVGSGDKLEVELAAGNYVVICNLPDHYRQGMRAGLTVS